MSEPAFPEPDVPVDSIDATTLSERLDAGERVTFLDTRVPADFEEWRIDGENVDHVNVPYFEFLADDPDEELFEQLPDDEELITVCAKGESSRYVSGVLEEHGYDSAYLEDGMRGWARVYDYTELDTDADATIAQYQRPSSGCLAYLVVSGDEAAVVDPLRAFTETYRQDARMLGAELKYAIDTHVHADHVSGVPDLAEAGDTEAVVPAAAEERGIDFDFAYETVADGERLALGDTTIEAVHTPGHTTGMTAYRVGDALFTGDGLFTESVARPDLEDEDAAREAAETLYDSLHETVLTLPGDTVVAPAHFSDAADPADDGTYTASLGDLAASMDALSMDREAFVEHVLADMPPRPANFEEIIATNLGQRDTGDEEAFTLELGPNNCAASRDAMTSD